MKANEKNPPAGRVVTRAPLLVQVWAKPGSSYERVELVVESVSLRAPDGTLHDLAVANRRLTWDLAKSDAIGFLTTAPAGTFVELVLAIAQASFVRRGSEKTPINWHGTLAVPATISVREREVTRLRLRADIEALSRGADVPAGALSAQSDVVGAAADHRVTGSGPATLTLDAPSFGASAGRAASLRLARTSFPKGTDVSLRRSDGTDLPPLFRGQRAVGSPVVIQASNPLHGEVTLTVSYDDGARAAAGFRTEHLVVLQLDDARTRYRELRPVVVDTTHHTLTVRTRTLSTFFAGTPGVHVEQPEIVVAAGGEALSDAVGRQIVVSGHADDRRATVTLQGTSFQRSWVAQGNFVFEGVALRISDTVIELHAAVEGLLPHIIPLTIRRAFPKKLIARSDAHYGSRVEYGSQGTPFVTAIVLDERDDAGGQGLRAALQSISRSVPTLFRYDADRDDWQSTPLMPPDYVENEMAKAGIYRLTAAGHNIPLNAQYPEVVRALRSLEDYVATLGQDTARHLGQFGASALTLLEARHLASPHHTISYAAPLVALADADVETVGVAFVVASEAGREAAADSSMGEVLGPFYRGRLLGGELDHDEILAGNLFFVRATTDGVRAVERVAGDIWCTSLVARSNPATGQPALLALGVAPDLGPGGLSGPHSTLTLFERRPDGAWRRETVLADRPVLDADFAYTAGGAPQVVAAIAGSEEFKGHLVYLTRRDDWIPEPIHWTLDTIELDLGMWPRIVLDDRERPVIAFSFFVTGNIFQFAGVRDDGGWRIARVATSSTTDLAATPAFVLGTDFRDDVLLQGGYFFGLTFADWAPALAVEAPQKVWCVFGKGVLWLAEIDTDSLAFTHVRLDVDRATGFAPALAVRGGAPTVVYKDCFGSSSRQGEQDFSTRRDLQFLAAGQGLAYPNEAALPALAPNSWRRSERSIFLGDFGEHTPLTCDIFRQAAEGVTIALAIDFLSALVGRPANATRDAVLLLTDKFLPSLLLTGSIDVDFVADTKTLTLSLVNDRFPQEDIARLEISVSDGQTPTVRAVERSGRTPACGLDQTVWDAVGLLFAALDFDPGSLIGNTSDAGLERITLTGMRLSFQPDDRTAQQGGVRFTLSIPSIVANGSKADVDWSAHSTQPSEFSFVLAPFAADGNLQWYVRETFARVGEIDVDVHLLFSWVGLVSLLVGLLPLVAIADPIADSVFTGLANEQRQGFQIGGLVGLVREIFSRFAGNRLFLGPLHTPRALDSVFFRHHVLTGLFRTPPPAVVVPAPAPLTVIPDPAVLFGQVVIGGAPVEKHLLLANDGALPLVVDDVAIQPPSPDFRVTSAPTWPQILTPGQSQTVAVTFTPRLPVGDRSASLEVRVRLAQTIVRSLRGQAGAPAGPLLVLSEPPDPARVFNVGAATVGTTRTAYVELGNWGTAPITVAAVAVQADAANAGVFAVAAGTPFPVPPNESRFLELTFTFAAMIAQGNHARLLVDTNHPVHPRQELGLVGHGLTPALVVSPAALDFGSTSLASTIGVTLYNTGAALLRIRGDSFRFLDAAGAASSEFQLLDGSQPVPLNDVEIQVGQGRLFTVVFRPTAAGQHDAQMTLRSNDIANPAVILNVTGRGL